MNLTKILSKNDLLCKYVFIMLIIELPAVALCLLFLETNLIRFIENDRDATIFFYDNNNFGSK